MPGNDAESGEGGWSTVRYVYTARGLAFLQSWNNNRYKYSIIQIYLGYNSISRLEVVSSLNQFSQAINMYLFDTESTSKYNPKVYLGSTLTTIADSWITDEKYPSSTTPNHDEVSTQKQVF